MNWNTTVNLALYIKQFTERLLESDFINVDYNSPLRYLDYEDASECWGCFRGPISIKIIKITIEINVEYIYYEPNDIIVNLYSKDLGVDKRIHNSRELKSELKKIAELLEEKAGPMVAEAFAEYI